MQPLSFFFDDTIPLRLSEQHPQFLLLSGGTAALKELSQSSSRVFRCRPIYRTAPSGLSRTGYLFYFAARLLFQSDSAKPCRSHSLQLCRITGERRTRSAPAIGSRTGVLSFLFPDRIGSVTGTAPQTSPSPSCCRTRHAGTTAAARLHTGKRSHAAPARRLEHDCSVRPLVYCRKQFLGTAFHGSHPKGLSCHSLHPSPAIRIARATAPAGAKAGLYLTGQLVRRTVSGM